MRVTVRVTVQGEGPIDIAVVAWERACEEWCRRLGVLAHSVHVALHSWRAYAR